MISAFAKIWDNIVGRGDAAVTVPALDGALRPNRHLDEAKTRLPLDDVDDLVSTGDTLLAAAGQNVHQLSGEGHVWSIRQSFPQKIAALTALGNAEFAVALASGEICRVTDGGAARISPAQPELGCITAMTYSDGFLYLANGSQDHGADDWQHDLLGRGSTGSLWRVDVGTGEAFCLASGLAYPAGLTIHGDNLVFSEAWRHRIVSMPLSAPGHFKTLYADLPGYPGRISNAAAGYWLAVFAPRSQLVEFVLREPVYRRRMMEEVPRPFWIAPKLSSGESFYEPLQGGGVKHLGLLKPWAPTLSAGMAVHLAHDFQPTASLHSRAGGSTHGVTAIVEHGSDIFAASRGGGVVVSMPVNDLGDDQ
ncbi:hypothetical protein [Roseibium sp.]|uniref:hypothetical protein n=1 Tax=Roseibium sp. TaxID=1936156 RepID=UPI003A96C6CE